MNRIKNDILLISNIAIALSSVIGVIGASGYYLSQITPLEGFTIVLLIFNLFIILLILVLVPIIIS